MYTRAANQHQSRLAVPPGRGFAGRRAGGPRGSRRVGFGGLTAARTWTEQERRLLAGGLPFSAEQRLSELRAAGMTSSFLSVDGEAVGALDGMEAIGQVVGASACRLGVGVVRRTRTGAGRLPGGTTTWREHEGPVRSWTEARQRALARLVEQARLLDANAVLGLRPTYEVGEREPRTAEVVFAGTAVRFSGSKGKRADPVVGLVSVQEFCLLRRAGVDVVGIAGACSAVELGPLSRLSSRGDRMTAAGSYELRELTIGIYEARRLAMQRLRSDARRLGASGVLGINLADSLADHRRGSVLHLLGTAVRSTSTRGLSPGFVLSLAD